MTKRFKVSVAVYDRFGMDNQKMRELWQDSFDTGKEAYNSVIEEFGIKWGLHFSGWDWHGENSVNRFQVRIWDAKENKIFNKL